MSTPYAIQVHDIGKKYKIWHGGQAAQYGTLRDQLAGMVKAPLRWVNRRSSSNSTKRGQSGKRTEDLWALRGINFEVRPGEVVGVIGQNGAGKSTLLKILTRITDPSEGYIDLWGRVGSLLEVGTGFHKELTGRENIYLNGAILGMKRSEIDRKFDEIVAFSEIEKFIDTPVKYYSSGMGVRLAFAVAAHLEPEILLVDEVLAVGDASFQKKCLNKMEDVGHQGRTILFVSHHMPSITRLCERVILLEGGQIVMDGPANKVVATYLSGELGSRAQWSWPFESAPGSDAVRLLKVRMIDRENRTRDTFDIRDDIGIEMEIAVTNDSIPLYPAINIFNEENMWLFSSIDNETAWRGRGRPLGRYTNVVWIPGNFLTEGQHIVSISVRSEFPTRVHLYENDVVNFRVIENPGATLTSRVDFIGQMPGVIRPYLEWETRTVLQGQLY